MRRTEIASAFLADPTQRALTHPSPTPRRCYLATRFGHLRFDRVVDRGPARDVPREALRRFRADVKAARERRARERAEHVRLRDERWQTMTAWVAEHGLPDQQARLAAGLLPPSEVREAMADEAFRALADRSRYTHDGVGQMRAHVQQWTGRNRHHVTERDFVVFGHTVRTVTHRQWALLEKIRAAAPDAQTALHLREFIWRRDPGVPRLTQLTLVVTKRIGPMLLRREYLVSDDEADMSGTISTGKESA